VIALLALTAALATASNAHAAVARQAASHRIMFGLGSEADGARTGALAKSSPLGMLSSWYNGPSDLKWLSGWETSEVPHDYAAGYDMHLIVWSGETRTTFSTPYGTACGKAYPVSPSFLSDMERLARIFRPSSGRTLYVTLFTEMQTYACNGNEWSGSPQTTAYYEALKSQYTAAMGIFHRLAPGSLVSLGWGGWQARWNGPATGAGKSLFKHFRGVMRASDFESFQMMGSDTDTSDILAMTKQLKRYGPVMLAYYEPSGGGGTVVGREHLKGVLAPAFLDRLAALRMFSMAFTSEEAAFGGDATSLGVAQEAVKAFGCHPCASPARAAKQPSAAHAHVGR
jgi:hypothetical protein